MEEIKLRLKSLVSEQTRLATIFNLDENQLEEVLDNHQPLHPLLGFFLTIIDDQSSKLETFEKKLAANTEEAQQALTLENQELKENLQNLEKSWTELNEELSKRNSVSDQQNLRRLGQFSLDDLQEELTERANLQNELQQFKDRLEEAINKRLEIEFATNHEKAVWRVKVFELKERIKTLENEQKAFNQHYQDLVDELTKLGMEIQTILAAYGFNELNVNKIIDMTNTKKITDLTAKIATYQTSLKELRTAAEEIAQKKLKLEQDLATALQELADAKDEVKELKLTKEIEDQETDAELDKANEGMDELGNEIAELQKLIAQMETPTNS